MVRVFTTGHRCARHAARALLAVVATFVSVSGAQTPAASNTVKVGKYAKVATGTVAEINSGDAACYITIKDEKGQIFDESGDFSLCEKPKLYLGKRVTLSYELGSVMSSECGGDPKCKKTTTWRSSHQWS
jgi:hypothetical protein